MAPKTIEFHNQLNNLLSEQTSVDFLARIIDSPPPLLQEVEENERFNITTTTNPNEVFIADPDRLFIPLEHNLRALLATGSDNLEEVTVVKLRVISRDVPLQHLSLHIPSLRELILDGSSVSSLRDLGNLRHVNVLRLNRCGLVNLDGLSTFACLEELYAAENPIENPTPCAFLAHIKLIDLRRCHLKNILHTLPFLTVCKNLTRIYLEGNDELSQFPKYRQTVKTLLPALRTLDGITYTQADDESEEPFSLQEFQAYLESKKSRSSNKETVEDKAINSSTSSTVANPINFTVTFPPKVFHGKPGSA